MTVQPDLGAAAEALQMWALYSGRFDVARSRLATTALPASVYTGLDIPGRPGSVVVRQLIADLEALAVSWEQWEADHPDRSL